MISNSADSAPTPISLLMTGECPAGVAELRALAVAMQDAIDGFDNAAMGRHLQAYVATLAAREASAS